MAQKRKTTRVLFEAKAELRHQGRIITGQVRNLSMKGMLLNTTEQIDPGAQAAITISLSGTSSELSLTINGHVVRMEPSGMAIEFETMDLDTFVHLRSIVAYNEGDENKIMDEFYNSF
jgi:hypothetical protein